MEILNWLGFLVVFPNGGQDHFLQFVECCSKSNSRRLVKVIWIATV